MLLTLRPRFGRIDRSCKRLNAYPPFSKIAQRHLQCRTVRIARLPAPSMNDHITRPRRLCSIRQIGERVSCRYGRRRWGFRGMDLRCCAS
jgi:hypothetical protein